MGVFLHLHLTCHCECQKEAKRMGHKQGGFRLTANFGPFMYLSACAYICVYVSVYVSACVCLQLTYGFFSVFGWFSCCKFCMKYFIRNVLHCIVYLCVCCLPQTLTALVSIPTELQVMYIRSFSPHSAFTELTQSKSQAVCKLALSRLIGVLLTAYKIYIKL